MAIAEDCLVFLSNTAVVSEKSCEKHITSSPSTPESSGPETPKPNEQKSRKYSTVKNQTRSQRSLRSSLGLRIPESTRFSSSSSTWDATGNAPSNSNQLSVTAVPVVARLDSNRKNWLPKTFELNNRLYRIEVEAIAERNRGFEKHNVPEVNREIWRREYQQYVLDPLNKEFGLDLNAWYNESASTSPPIS